jgi:hypothetical protein
MDALPCYYFGAFWLFAYRNGRFARRNKWSQARTLCRTSYHDRPAAQAIHRMARHEGFVPGVIHKHDETLIGVDGCAGPPS